MRNTCNGRFVQLRAPKRGKVKVRNARSPLSVKAQTARKYVQVGGSRLRRLMSLVQIPAAIVVAPSMGSVGARWVAG